MVDGAARVWVVDGNHRTRRVLVMAQVLEEVETTLELLWALDGLNALTPHGRYFHAGEAVVIEETVLADDLTPGALFNALGFVGWAADNARGYLAVALGEDALGGPGSASEPNGVDVQELAQPFSTPPPQAMQRGTDGVVSAGGYV